MQVLLQMWFSMRRYARWTEIAQHMLRAERELLSAFTVLSRALKDAAAPYTKDDPLAAVLFEVFAFFERSSVALTPIARPLADSSEFFATQRRALLTIRDVLLEERAAITPDPTQSRQRANVIDAILGVIDRQLDTCLEEQPSPLDSFGGAESKSAEV